MQPVPASSLGATGLLWQGQERFRGAFVYSGIGMAIVSPEGLFLDVNPALCRFLGYTEAEFERLDFQTLTHPDDLAGDLLQVKRMLAGEIETYSMEKRYRHKDGHFLWGLLTVSLVSDADGMPIHFLSQIQDVTERRRIQEELRLEEERLALATKVGGVGVWDVSLTVDSVTYNEVACGIFKLDPGNPVLKRAVALQNIHPEDRESVRELFRRCVETNIPYVSEHRIVRHDGEIRHMKAYGRCLRDETTGQPLRVIGTVIDITEEKQASEELARARDAAQAADKAKSEFLAMMSHEIRTPMNGVLGFTSLLKTTPLDERQLNFLETIELSGERLLELINDVLDLSKIEAGTMAIHPACFDLRACVRGVFDLLRPAAMEKGLHYHYHIAPDVPTGILCDRGRLAQILINILGNAVKFTAAGTVELHVTAAPLGGTAWQWSFRISDTGPGISSEAMTQIFQPFFQADHSLTRQHGGSGLGLAISHKLAELLGGSITASNHPAGGMEFLFVLNATEAQPASCEPVPIHLPNLKGKKILVIEDNEANRKLCEHQLRHLDCLSDFAGTGGEGIEKARTGHHDLVLMDMQLPDLDGCSATREIRRHESENSARRLPIIAITANAMAEDRQRCLDAGMDDYLSKPLKLETLSACLAKWL